MDLLHGPPTKIRNSTTNTDLVEDETCHHHLVVMFSQQSVSCPQVTVLPTKGPAVTVQRLNNVKPQGQNDDSSSTDEDDEEVTLDIHMLNSAEDVEGLRMLAHSSLRSFQWVFTGNLFLPVVSAVLAELLWVLLVKHADPELRDDMSAGANDYV